MVKWSSRNAWRLASRRVSVVLATMWWVAAAAQADDGPSGLQASAPTTASPTERWSDRVRFEGLIDAFASHRAGNAGIAPNEFRAFDLVNDSFHVGYAELAIETKGTAGLRLDIGFGPGADLSSADTPSAGAPLEVSNIFKQVQQAYATIKLPTRTSLTLDVGKFTTSAGAEVIEAKDNWTYSRSMLFLTGPYTHTGARLTAEPTERLTLQAAVVNGWESITAPRVAKTVGLAAAYTLPSQTALGFATYQGLETVANDRWLQFYDLLLEQPFGDKLALNVNAALGLTGGESWYGVSTMLRYVPLPYLRLTLRGEHFNDPDGLKTAVEDADGQLLAMSINAVTMTAGVPIGGFSELRMELRHDMASRPYFHGGTRNTQTTTQLAALAWF